MKKIFSLFAVVFMAMCMFAEPVTLTFKDWGDTAPKSETDSTPKNQAGDFGTAYTTANIKDSIEGADFLDTVTVATKLYAARVGYGCKLGSSKAIGKFVANLATPAQFDSIVFVASSYSTSEGSVKVCGGDVIDLTNGGTDNKVLKRLIYVPTGIVDSISFETTAKRAYLKSIIFYPAAGSTGGSDPVTPGAGITYELNGGAISNYYSAQDMYADLNADYNAAIGTTATWLPLAECTATNQGIPTAVASIDIPFFTTDGSKWKWLVDYLDVVSATQSVAVASSSSAALRYNLQSFFKDWQHTGWPKSADYTTCGVSTPSAYQSLWKSGFGNPTNPTDTFVLNEPYKEGFTFDGWYAAADFSGAKVTTIDPSTSGTLYAKWIIYVPTIAEVKALADSTETKVAGVVTFIDKKKVYIQDATGGMLLYMSATPSFNVGDKVIVNGLKVMYDGAPEITDITVLSTEASTVPAAAKFETLKAACKDANLFTRVSLNGLKIVAFDSYNNPSVTDGVDTVLCFKMAVDSTFTIGAKVNITAILATYQGDYQFVGNAAEIELAPLGVKDTYAYPARGANGEYTLENKWVISKVEDNYEANKPGVDGYVRGMAAKDGIMYFINRTYGSLVRVDAATGTMLDPLPITGDHLFEALDTTDSTYTSAVTLPFNDIKFDGAGNCLIGACISGSQHFMIYKVDLTTGAATLLIDEKLVDNDDFATIADDGSRSWGGRFDAFGVYGDVNSDAIVMAADANSFYAYKWTITNGVAGAAEQIDCALEPSSDQSLLIKDGAVSVTNFGTAPQIFPVDADYFYVDGWNTLPMLYDMDGMLADDFINSPSGVNVVNNEGDTCKMNLGHNGLCEFQVGDEYFMVMAATNTVGNPPSAFALYKFADASKSFTGLEPLWYFPANGMGSATNGFRTAVPSVEVNGTKATIYLYAGNNGYGVYEFTGKEAGPTVIENLYEIGDNQGWKPAEGIAMTKTAENVFKGEFTFTAPTSYFAFTTVQSDNWDLVNANRFGGAENNQLVADGTVAPLATGELCLTIAPGTYNITVDLNAMTATVEAVATGLENTEAGNVTKIVENGQVYIIKNGVRYNVLGTTVEK